MHVCSSEPSSGICTASLLYLERIPIIEGFSALCSHRTLCTRGRQGHLLPLLAERCHGHKRLVSMERVHSYGEQPNGTVLWFRRSLDAAVSSRGSRLSTPLSCLLKNKRQLRRTTCWHDGNQEISFGNLRGRESIRVTHSKNATKKLAVRRLFATPLLQTNNPVTRWAQRAAPRRKKIMQSGLARAPGSSLPGFAW